MHKVLCVWCSQPHFHYCHLSTSIVRVSPENVVVTFQQRRSSHFQISSFKHNAFRRWPLRLSSSRIFMPAPAAMLGPRHGLGGFRLGVYKVDMLAFYHAFAVLFQRGLGGAFSFCKAFVKSPYNIIDFCALLPLVIRIIAGVETPTLAENAVVHYTLVCFVPLIRLLKLVRRFKKLQLLLPHGQASRNCLPFCCCGGAACRFPPTSPPAKACSVFGN